MSRAVRLEPQFIRIDREYFERVRPLLRRRTHEVYEALLLECDGWDQPVLVAKIAAHVRADYRDVKREICFLEAIGLIRSVWKGPKTSPRAQRSVLFPREYDKVVHKLTSSAWGRNTPKQPRHTLLSSRSATPYPQTGGDDVIEFIWKIFGPTVPAMQIRNALRKLAPLRPEASELRKFLRWQSEHRDLRGIRFPMSVVCDPDEFEAWRVREARRSAPPATSRAPGGPKAKPLPRSVAENARRASQVLARLRGSR